MANMPRCHMLYLLMLGLESRLSEQDKKRHFQSGSENKATLNHPSSDLASLENASACGSSHSRDRQKHTIRTRVG